MKRDRLTLRARADLYQLVFYIAERNRTAARRIHRGLIESFRILGQNPLIGQSRGDLLDSLRTFSYRNYVVCYRPKDNCVEILRILHAARDWEREFDE